MPIAPAFTWTGFYVGVNAGYGWTASKTTRYVGTPDYVALGSLVPQSAGLSNDGFVGGAQAGYNYQMGAFVLGAEADIQYADLKKSASVSAPLATSTIDRNLDWFGTVRLRAGCARTQKRAR